MASASMAGGSGAMQSNGGTLQSPPSQYPSLHSVRSVMWFGRQTALLLQVS